MLILRIIRSGGTGIGEVVAVSGYRLLVNVDVLSGDLVFFELVNRVELRFRRPRLGELFLRLSGVRTNFHRFRKFYARAF